MRDRQNTAAALVAQSPARVPPLEKSADAQKGAKSPVVRTVSNKRGTGAHSTGIFATLITLLLVWGWWSRDARSWWDPEHGLGYALGIAGLSCVGILMIYPLRKRIPVLRSIGSVPFWFHTHMMLGIVAPALILFHSNFSLGSINSNIALFTMLIVASSGIIGRFLYVRIHRDMNGRKAVAREILTHAELMRLNLAASFGGSEHLVDRMHDLETSLRTRPEYLFQAIRQASHAHRETHRIQAELHDHLKVAIGSISRRDSGRRKALRIQARTTSDLFESYRITVNQAARLSLYERFFALWHVLHLPLFFLMVMAAAIHVVAVHLY